MGEMLLDITIGALSAYLSWSLWRRYRRTSNPRVLMLAGVFLVIAIGQSLEVVILRLLKTQSLLWLAQETSKNAVLLLALVGTAIALSGMGWRETLKQRPGDEQPNR